LQGPEWKRKNEAEAKKSGLMELKRQELISFPIRATFTATGALSARSTALTTPAPSALFAHFLKRCHILGAEHSGGFCLALRHSRLPELTGLIPLFRSKNRFHGLPHSAPIPRISGCLELGLLLPAQSQIPSHLTLHIFPASAPHKAFARVAIVYSWTRLKLLKVPHRHINCTHHD
jgi:hypothetical protein